VNTSLGGAVETVFTLRTHLLVGIAASFGQRALRLIDQIQSNAITRLRSMVLKKLHRPFMIMRGFETLEDAQIPAFPCFWVLLARVQSVLPGLELPNH
jgi:hypothetical protein